MAVACGQRPGYSSADMMGEGTDQQHGRETGQEDEGMSGGHSRFICPLKQCKNDTETME